VTDLWAVVEIGCLECHIDSDCLGVYTSQAQADAAVEQILAQRRAKVTAEWQAEYGKHPDLSRWSTGIDYSDESEGNDQIRVFQVPAFDTPGEYPHARGADGNMVP
jgi:hypothetical protein